MARLPQPYKSLRGELESQRTSIRRLQSSSAFSGTGISIVAPDTLSFLPGLISNDALAAPDVPGAAGVEVTGFGVSTTPAEVAGLNLTVPVGCSQLLATVVGQAYAENVTLTDDALWAYVDLAGTASTPLGTMLPASGLTTSTATLATTLTGLTPGATLRLGVWASTSVNTLAAAPAHVATLTATLTWLP